MPDAKRRLGRGGRPRGDAAVSGTPDRSVGGRGRPPGAPASPTASTFVRGALATVLAVAFVLILLVNGYSSSVIGRDSRVHPPASTDAVPQAVLDGGPVVDTRNGGLQALRSSNRTAAAERFPAIIVRMREATVISYH